MQLPKTYDPKLYERDIYEMWEKNGFFKPTGGGEPFCIIMPPPNANGKLHWGHAIGYTTEDIITRYKRMNGYRTLWFPGTDHAGIETQFVYERDVLAPQGKTRFDLGPAKFYQAVMKYTLESGKDMIDQFRAMGFSADWSKLKFTLDKDIIDLVYDTFIKLHKEGYVYRGNRIVNWCSRCQAAFADIELDHENRTDIMYTLDYGLVQIATVRPETIFADVALAVNPKDKRYNSLVGKDAIIPLINRPVPIIADTYVDPDFGTGALKITPGHDPNDYEIGLRHELPQISVIDNDGKLINVPEEFAGLTVIGGKERVVAALKTAGTLVKTKSYKHTVAIHDRCGTVIEPLISEQWFLRVKELNKAAIKAFKTQLEVFPKRFTKIALNWLEQEHDWNISRQIWWGIRIPVYYKTSNDPNKRNYIVAKTEAEAAKYYGKGNYRAETDTFDTWFSSGQWPFVTLMTTGDFETFYPTSLMGTAREILHKWITRMVMMGLYSTGKIPFRQVYLWGLVTDEHGQKMSKSKGNVIDPLVITARYGTDALRLAGAISNTPGNDSPMSEKRVEGMRNFNNKLWNIARYILVQVPNPYTPKTPQASTLAEQWMLNRLHQTIKIVTQKIESYRLNEAVNELYHLVWDDLADWYVEISKNQPNVDLLVYSLETVLKLLHPFAPFISETLWQQLRWQKKPLIVANWPKAKKLHHHANQNFSQVQAIIAELRTLKTSLKLNQLNAVYCTSKLISQNRSVISRLVGLKSLTEVKSGRGLPLLSAPDGMWLEVPSQTTSKYKTTLKTTKGKLTAYIKSLDVKLSNRSFVAKAPKEVVKGTKQQLVSAKAQLNTINERLQLL